MFTSPLSRFLGGCVAALLCAATLPTSPVSADPDPLAGMERRSAEPVVETVPAAGDDDSDGHFIELPPSIRGRTLLERSLAARPPRGRDDLFARRIDGTMTTTYQSRTPMKVRQVIDAAVAAWDDSLDLSPNAPVEISVLWTDLGDRLLGQAGTEGEYRDPRQFPTDRWYPAALANQLVNLDINGPDTPEILIELNSGLGDDWYIGTQGSPSFGQIDLFSVVLHEIAHGLGFLGSAVSTRTGGISVDHDPPSIYDDLVFTEAGAQLISLGEDDVVDALTGGALRIDIGGGRLMPLSAPGRFVNGSSYSHFDESIPESDAGAMMTPALKNGEVQRHLDAAVLGVLDGVGWRLDTPILEPTIGDVEVRSGGLLVEWVEDWRDRVTLPAQYQVSALPLSASGPLPMAVVRSIRGESAPQVRLHGLQNGTSYKLSVLGTHPDHVPGRTAGTTVVLPPNPNPVRSLRVGKSLDRVAVSWDEPVASGEPVHTYEVQYRTATERDWSIGSTSQTAWTQPLADGRYWFRVRAMNDVGEGLWSKTELVGLAAGSVRPMPLDGQLARLYRAYFNRDADPDGLRYWRDVRSNAVRLDVVSNLFASSKEFDLTYGDLGDGAFVEQMYQNVLGRSADEEGFQYWTGLLADGVPRGTVVLGFSESAEFISLTGTVKPQSARSGAFERAHMAVLLRAPTASELSVLVNSRNSLAQVTTSLATSAEARQLWGTSDPEELLDAILREFGLDAQQIVRATERFDTGERIGRLISEATQTPRFVAETGTGI